MMSEIYNEQYYAGYNGGPYSNREIWKPFFMNIARQIVEDIQPKTVLDVGCAWGYIVESLRDLGVEAYGLDISEYAISHVREDVRPYCAVGSLLDPLPPNFPTKFDLVVNVEMMEHLYEEDCRAALSKLCSYADDILFSSSPDDITDPTHYNVQQAEYWAKLFAQQGFYRVLEYHVDYIATHAVRFTRRDLAPARLVENYERQMRIKIQVLEQKLREECEKRDRQLAALDQYGKELLQQHDEAVRRCEKLKNDLVSVKTDLKFTREGYQIIANSTFWRLTKPLRFLLDRVKRRLKKPQEAAPAATAVNWHSEPQGTDRVENFLQEEYRSLQAIPAFHSENRQKRINLILERLEAYPCFGGAVAALMAATELANQYRLPLRIITRDAAALPLVYNQILALNGVDKPADVSFYSDFDRDLAGNKNFKLELSTEDIFIAASWRSAVAASKTTLKKQFFYVVQDYEWLRYPCGADRHFFAKLLKNPDITLLVNTAELFAALVAEQPDLAKRGCSFQPAFPLELCSPHAFATKAKYNLCFSAYGLEVLEECIQNGILTAEEWEFYCLGENIPPLTFRNGCQIQRRTFADSAEYEHFLQQMDLSLTFMEEANSVHLAYDVLNAGGVAVLGALSPQTPLLTSKNLLVSDMEKESLAAAIEQGIALVKDVEKRKRNFEQAHGAHVWRDCLPEVIRVLGENMDHA